MVIAVGAWCACGCTQADPSAEEPSAAGARTPAPERVGRVPATAMDLRAVAGAAWLASAHEGVLRVQRLGPRGTPEGEARVVARDQGRVAALALEAAAGRLALAWISVTLDEAHVRAITGTLRPGPFGPPETVESWPWSAIGESANREGGPTPNAGDLALHAGPTGDFRLLHRTSPEACQGEACVAFRHHVLGHHSQAGRRGVVLAVPERCERALYGVSHAQGRTYYGLCGVQQGAPLSTLYLLQPEPQYAQAEPAFEGCEPGGVLARADGEGVLFSAHCPEGRRGVAFELPGVPPRVLGQVEAPGCVGGMPSLHVGEAREALSSTRDRLEAFLPPELARVGDRVVWTGQAYVRARLDSGAVLLESWSCAPSR